MQFEEVALAHNPTDDEWYSISVFKERAQEVIDQLQRLKLTGIMTFHFARNPDGSYKASGEIPSDDDLRILYFDFRHLYAEQEAGNYFRVLQIISRCSGDQRVVRYMRDLKKQSRSSIVESGFFHDGDRRLSGKQLIDAWFNARLFHSDRERRDELARLNNWLSIDGVRILLFHAIRDATLAAKNLYYLIKDLGPDNPVVLLAKQVKRVNEHRSA